MRCSGLGFKYSIIYCSLCSSQLLSGCARCINIEYSRKNMKSKPLYLHFGANFEAFHSAHSCSQSLPLFQLHAHNMLSTYIYHYLRVSAFVTPSSGRPLRYLLKKYVFCSDVTEVVLQNVKYNLFF